MDFKTFSGGKKLKATKLTIRNIGKIGNAVIEINKPLILFYGEIMEGKTTILNSIKFCFGGGFPSDIIKHGETEAEVMLEFEGGSITRQLYIGKDGKVKPRPIKLILNGKPIAEPTKKIKEFMNPFLLDQDHLRNMTELERQRYFIDLFDIDTSELDELIATAESEAKTLRITIKGYGEIDLTKYESVDISGLEAQKKEIIEKYEAEIKIVDEFNTTASEHDTQILLKENEIARLASEILELQLKLDRLKDDKYLAEEWIKSNPEIKPKVKPEAPNTSDIDKKLSNAEANEVRVEQYKTNLAQSNKKKKDQKSLADYELQSRNAKKQKIELLKGISESSGIKKLSFDESGNFSYMGTQAGMLSTAQIMKLSSELSDLYPEGFGLDLIDRGESLGKSIFDFVKKAEDEEKTILATIVGQRPADVPGNIGVFVVENGEVK
jgi:DNA repair ATPase RecN